jgi:hypothetical protein
VRLWKGLGWLGLFLFIFLADALPAAAQQATGLAVPSDFSTRSVAGQQRIGPDGLPDSPGALRSGLQKAAYQQSRSEKQSMPDAGVESQTAKPQASLPSQSSRQSPQPPLGTAAAGALTVGGVLHPNPQG